MWDTWIYCIFIIKIRRNKIKMLAANNYKLIVATQLQNLKFRDGPIFFQGKPKLYIKKKKKNSLDFEFIKQKQRGQTKHICGLEFVLRPSVSCLGKFCFINEISFPIVTVCSKFQRTFWNQWLLISIWRHRDEWYTAGGWTSCIWHGEGMEPGALNITRVCAGGTGETHISPVTVLWAELCSPKFLMLKP